MRKQYTRAEWSLAVASDPGLMGVSPVDAAKRLGLDEQAVGELMLKGYLNVSDICEKGEVVEIIIPERDVQEYAVTRQAQRDRYPS